MIARYSNGKICSIRYGGLCLHRNDGPALIEYYNDGILRSVGYYINGEPHRERAPAILRYFPNGNVSSVRYCRNGKIHRDKWPAHIQFDVDGKIVVMIYAQNGIWKRDSFLPAVINRTEIGNSNLSVVHTYPFMLILRYAINGTRIYKAAVKKTSTCVKHWADDGTKIIHYIEENGNKIHKYYSKGKLCRMSYKIGSRKIVATYSSGVIEEIEYYKHGFLHRRGSPAIKNYRTGLREYYINGVLVD